MNVFIRAMVRIFSFGEYILTIALINIHYLYTISIRNSFKRSIDTVINQTKLCGFFRVWRNPTSFV